MIKNLCLLLSIFFVLGFQSAAEAHYGHGHHNHRPPPYVTPYPQYPVYPQPYQVTCYVQGLINGAVFYGYGSDIMTASRWAFQICNSTGQYCQALGCR